MYSLDVLFDLGLDPGDEASATKLSAVRASSLERLLQFGRDLQLLNSELKREHGPCPADDKLLQVGNTSFLGVFLLNFCICRMLLVC